MVEMYSREIKHYAMMIYRKEKSLRKVQYLLEISKSTISRWKNLLTHDEKKKNKSNEDNQPVIIDTINFISKTNHSFSIRDIQQHLKCKLGITCSYELISLKIYLILRINLKIIQSIHCKAMKMFVLLPISRLYLNIVLLLQACQVQNTFY